MNLWRRVGALGTVGTLALALAACGSSKDEATPASTTAPPTTVSGSSTPPPATSTPASTSTSTPASTSSPGSTSTAPSNAKATLTAPDEVGAGERFEVAWTGPSGRGDFVTIVASGVTKWTNEPYFYATAGTGPQPLVAPVADGDYALVYISGETDAVLARRELTVTPFEGALGAPAEVEAGSNFQVAWKGPNGPGDYVTIVAADATKWTNEPYFYTSTGSPGTLVAPIEAGVYVLWYVTAADGKPMAERPITVTPFEVTLDAPPAVRRGATFEVEWTGPDGPQDYITIVPAGSTPGTYLSYAYTNSGSPVTLTAPDSPGKYEIWYASDRAGGTFASIDIVVT